MELLFLCIIVFLFLLAVFDLSVGVSNDAVNFLNSALGTKAASFRTILVIASAGVFIGASMSNGMMDIARHGIFRPEQFSFYDIICIFMAVMVTDIILLDIFNSLGMPTSTTVSMVFELLGAAFVVAMVKMASGADVSFSGLLNTEKALSIILGIFLSVAIAFVFGALVQFIARTVFSFEYRSRLKWKIGIFGGICITAIIYFILIKGIRDLAFMTPAIKETIAANTGLIIVSCLIASTLLMQLLHVLGVNVFKVIILAGTFALAMAFAGNDLVNFIGVPLSGLAAYQDFVATGASDAATHMMGSLNRPASTPLWFLTGAGVIMVVSLATSRKALNVSRTEIGLGSAGGDEMFGSSRIARRIVRWSLRCGSWLRLVTPACIRRWFSTRFDTEKAILENGAAFDMIRGSVNLVLAGALIALGTSMKLPLSTTFVTFMVAMGTSLADRAWGRESAVFRITGVISVIGGWFLTAGAAFIGAGVIVAAMHFGGYWIMLTIAALTACIIIRSNRRFAKKSSSPENNGSDALFQSIITSDDKENNLTLLLLYISEQQHRFICFAAERYSVLTSAFIQEKASVLTKAETSLAREKTTLKNARRKETLCLRYITHNKAIEKSPWFYLANNCCMGMLYNLRRIAEVCREHVDNNFSPLPSRFTDDYRRISDNVLSLLHQTADFIKQPQADTASELRQKCEALKTDISETYHYVQTDLHSADMADMAVTYVYVNTLQETREMISALRKYIRAYAKLRDTGYSSRI